MIVLGLVLLLIVATVAIVVSYGGGDPVQVHLHWFTVGTNGTTLFIAGAASTAVTLLALGVLRRGLRRARRQRREVKELRQRAEASQHSATSAARPATRTPPPTSPRHHEDADDYYDTAPRE